jgi:hypothetical protein
MFIHEVDLDEKTVVLNRKECSSSCLAQLLKYNFPKLSSDEKRDLEAFLKSNNSNKESFT